VRPHVNTTIPLTYITTQTFLRLVFHGLGITAAGRGIRHGILDGRATASMAFLAALLSLGFLLGHLDCTLFGNTTAAPSFTPGYQSFQDLNVGVTMLCVDSNEPSIGRACSSFPASRGGNASCVYSFMHT